MNTKQILKIASTLFVVMLFSYTHVQGQATDTSIQGVVVDQQGEALPGATVVLVNQSTGYRIGTSTNVNGEFSFRQLPLGGPYVLTFTYVGYSEESRSGIQLSLGDVVNLTIDLREGFGELGEIVVTADNLRDRIGRTGQTTSITAREIQSLPVQDRNFYNLSELDPLRGRSYAMAGSRATSTNFTVDGMNARGNRTGSEQGRGPFGISMESIREFEVHTFNYDVTIGRQGGGGINAATKSGTNKLDVTTFGYLRHDQLTANTDLRGNSIDNSFSNVQFGITAGGPIVSDKAHFFVAWDRQMAQRPIDVINLATDDDQISSRVTPGTLNELLNIAQAKYGVQGGPADQTGMFTQDGIQDAVFAKVDWQINERNSFTLTNNFTLFNSDFVSGGDQLAIRESRPGRYSLVLTTSAALRTTVSDNFTNVFQFLFNINDDQAKQDIGMVPRIFVRTNSVLPNGNDGQRDIQLGGHRWSPNYSNERNLQFKNTSYYSNGGIDYTFGSDLLFGFHDVWISSTTFGLFQFESLEAFDAMQPFRYSRLTPVDGIAEQGRDFWVLDGGIFGQARFNATSDIEVMLGLRWDVHYLLSKPGFNPTVNDKFGFDTSHRPLDLTNIQPRFSVTWNVDNQDRNIIKLGGGAFSSWNNYYSYITKFLYNEGDFKDLTLTGNAVPTPDFNSYRNDPNTIPGLPAGTNLSDLPELIAFSGENSRTPYTFKGNLSYSRFFSERFRTGINFTGMYTINNYHFFDRNLADPFFTVDPDNRPVFVPASSIRANGNTNYQDGRRHKEFTQVLEMVSEGKSYHFGVILDADYNFTRGGRIFASYTLGKAMENTPYNGNNAISALGTRVQNDPRKLEWARASNDFRHKIILSGTLPAIYGFVVSGSYIGISGAPINAVINRDIMGTSTSGDELAFIFDPNDPATPANIAEGMRKVLNNPENKLAGYLEDNLGTRAERNGATDSFSGILNLRIARSIALPGFRAEVMLDAFNFMNVFNNEWGFSGFYGSNQTLLNVTGFDQETQQYQYRVNEGFGTPSRRGTPYQIQLSVRISI